jgi:phosphohistidine phosphatase
VKQLILFRHAKSSWKSGTRADVSRPLADRGKRDAPRMGRRLAARGARPALVLSSHAARALETARLIMPPIGYDPDKLEIDEDLYLASPDEILDVVAAQDDVHPCLLLVGHNPGLTELANVLVPELAIDNLPTSGVVAIDLAVSAWKDVRAGAATLAYYDYPSNPELFVTEN